MIDLLQWIDMQYENNLKAISRENGEKLWRKKSKVQGEMKSRVLFWPWLFFKGLIRHPIGDAGKEAG